MKSVAIVVPNYALRQMFGAPSVPPIGPALVAAALREHGVEVAVIDADAEDLSLSETVERTLSCDPAAVGISCNYISKHNPTIALARKINRRGGPFVFVGGNHASADAAALLGADGQPIDAVLRGEGEVSAPTLLDALAGRAAMDEVPGLCVLRDGKAADLAPRRHVADLDALPLPAYDLLPMDCYSRFALVTSRGCPYRCSYCASTEIAGTHVRLRSAASVVDEVRLLRENHGEQFFWISDDTFTAVRRHAAELSAAFARLDPKPQWSCLTNIATPTDELLGAMHDGGCEYLSLGVESTHPDHKRFIGKPVSDDGVVEAVWRIHRAGMRAYGFFIIGFPGENAETAAHRVRLIERAGFDGVAVNLLIPLPGTGLWDELVAGGFLDPGSLDRDTLFARTPEERVLSDHGARYLSVTELSPAELMAACEQCRAAAGRSAHGQPC